MEEPLARASRKTVHRRPLASSMKVTTRSAVAEGIGTFFFVFIAGGSIIVDQMTGSGIVSIAMATGLALSIGITATMNISGGHLNPAVTIGFLVAGKIEMVKAGAYILAQLVGAAVAGLLLLAFFPAEAGSAVHLGTPALGEGVSFTRGLGIEIVTTFFLMLAFIGTLSGGKAPSGLGGFGVGLTAGLIILATGPLTGGAMNPARHFGTALASGYFDNTWLYWLGPIIGAVLGISLLLRVLSPKNR